MFRQTTGFTLGNKGDTGREHYDRYMRDDLDSVEDMHIADEDELRGDNRVTEPQAFVHQKQSNHARLQESPAIRSIKKAQGMSRLKNGSSHQGGFRIQPYTGRR